MGQGWGSNLIYGIVLPDRIYHNWSSHSEHGGILEEFCEKFGLGALVGANGDDRDTVEGLAIGIVPEQISGDGIESAEAITTLDFEAITKAREEFESKFTHEFAKELVPVLNKLLLWDESDDRDFDEFNPEELNEEEGEEKFPWGPDVSPIKLEELVNAKAQLISIAYYNV